MKPRLRILNAEPVGYSDEARAGLNELGELQEEACDRARLETLVTAAEVLIVRLAHRVDNALLARAPQLRVVVTATTGLNHIDLSAAAAHGVEVLSLQGETDFLRHVTATAELAWGLTLALARRLAPAWAQAKSGHWDRDALRGTELSGKTLGILGLGRLGRIVADYARTFRMRVCAHDPAIVEPPAGVTLCGFEETLAVADVLSLHVTLHAGTRGLLNTAAFARMKPGVLIVNTARGEVIDERALIVALESGRVAGVAADVLCGETSGDPAWLKHNPLWQFAQTSERVLLTPHIGGATRESMAATELFMVGKLKRFLETHPERFLRT
ncbi:MAG: D-glycerate dehydrogenase [Kiritimatiellaeota bacterium]|nr:D-glycerate dehydrogenase [Kiritimatiellota bacterium]